MKSKKLLFSFLFGLSGLSAYLVLTSSANASQGVMGASAIGCGSCHGSANAATTITITGIPAGGYVNGTTYNLSLKVANASKLGAGFDLSVSAGSLSNAPANTMLMGSSELHHTATLPMTAGEAIWNFSWTAPASGNTVTFNVSGNAVNNNNSDSGDQWNKISIDYTKAAPNTVNEIEATDGILYPNPANQTIRLKSKQNIDGGAFWAVSLHGQLIKLAAQPLGNHEYQMNVESLANGNYMLFYSVEEKVQHMSFSKCN